MATKRDSYEPTVNNQQATYDVYAESQVWTTTSAYKVTSVYLVLYKNGSPNDLNVYIVPTTGGQTQAIANAICSGSKAAAGITTDTNGVKYEITLGAGANVTDATKYGIIYYQNLAAPNYIAAKMRYDTSLYAGGSMWESSNSGASFPTEYTDRDLYFEVWGDNINTNYDVDIVDSGAGAGAGTVLNEIVTTRTRYNQQKDDTQTLNESFTKSAGYKLQVMEEQGYA